MPLAKSPKVTMEVPATVSTSAFPAWPAPLPLPPTKTSPPPLPALPPLPPWLIAVTPTLPFPEVVMEPASKPAAAAPPKPPNPPLPALPPMPKKLPPLPPLPAWLSARIPPKFPFGTTPEKSTDAVPPSAPVPPSPAEPATKLSPPPPPFDPRDRPMTAIFGRLAPTVIGPDVGVATLTVTFGPACPDGPPVVVPAMQAPRGLPWMSVLGLQLCDPSVLVVIVHSLATEQEKTAFAPLVGIVPEPCNRTKLVPLLALPTLSVSMPRLVLKSIAAGRLALQFSVEPVCAH